MRAILCIMSMWYFNLTHVLNLPIEYCFIVFKGVVPILTGAISTPNWLTLTLKTHFAQCYPKFAFYFLSWDKNKYVILGWGCYKKMHKKICIPEIGAFSATTSKVQWIWSSNFGEIMRQLWAFIWHQKSTTSGCSLGDENVISI